MTTKTHAAFGDPKNNTQQAVGLFATHMNRNSTMARLTGKMPAGIAGAEATLRNQTTQHMPIVRAQDLGKGTGDEITFQLLNPVSATPIMGSKMAEGRGTGMKISEDRLRVNQARFPIDLGDNMTTIRSPVNFRALGRPVAQSLMDRYIDQSLLVHMAGARGTQDNIEWTIPTDKDPEFDEIMVNPVKAPTKNRHFMAQADGIATFAQSAGEMSITSADQLKMDTVDSMRSVLDQMILPPPIVKFEGDMMADDSPLRVWMMSPSQYNKFSMDPQFRQFQAAALSRASNAGNHPLFKGEAGIWNGFLLIKMPKPIRFYAGDDIKYCDSYYTETESATKVPASFADKFAIDRSVILGGQAVAEALAASDKTGIPFFWSEKELDHGDKVELLIGAIRGVSKIRFAVDAGADGKEITDYGVTVVDTVVNAIGRGR